MHAIMRQHYQALVYAVIEDVDPIGLEYRKAKEKKVVLHLKGPTVFFLSWS